METVETDTLELFIDSLEDTLLGSCLKTLLKRMDDGNFVSVLEPLNSGKSPLLIIDAKDDSRWTIRIRNIVTLGGKADVANLAPTCLYSLLEDDAELDSIEKFAALRSLVMEFIGSKRTEDDMVWSLIERTNAKWAMTKVFRHIDGEIELIANIFQPEMLGKQVVDPLLHGLGGHFAEVVKAMSLVKSHFIPQTGEYRKVVENAQPQQSSESADEGLSI